MIERIGVPAMFELLAEECTELAHASLKYARALRGENPTPKTTQQCQADISEEVADVMLVLEQITGVIRLLDVDEVMDRKLARWEERLK